MRKSKQSQGRTPGQGNRSLFRRTVFLLGIIGIAAFTTGRLSPAEELRQAKE